ncbi:universal stress protein [Halosolutus gelatinilyticus]|uniref:universal stress protein n=1 Tax=Halosolutus gelatinilyticus TaxID=2931975 RepID=UPI001FF6C43A|nr:universal stress protein [Halosolutus gelatinilyticus]
MLSRVLVPMDGSELSERALEYALENHPDASITVLTVVGEPSIMMGEAMSIAFEDNIEDAAKDRARGVLDRARELADDHDAEVDTAISVGRPGRAIVDRAADYDAVVIGSHGSDVVGRLFVGDVADVVFRRSPVPVTVVR